MLLALTALAVMSTSAANDWVVYEGTEGPGVGKHIVFLAGDEEYRSEEGLPQLAKILAFRHGFKCTVLFSIGEGGVIDPDVRDNQPGLEALDEADLCVMLLRFREWPDEQMKHFVDYYLAGKPIIALRTSTHAFDHKSGAYKRFGFRSKEWPGGFGKHVLGETWVSHWGIHGVQATRGIFSPQTESHLVLRGVKDVFVTTDVYEAHPNGTTLMFGEVVDGMRPDAPAATGKKMNVFGNEQGLNEFKMSIVWLRDFKNESGNANRILTTTMGAATDLLNEGLRRLLVNGAYWMVGLSVPDRADVSLVGVYEPSDFGFGGFRKGVKPSDHEGRVPRSGP
ncbi:MAG: hypothetical protein IH944_13350 [Armatimonadetes bacterium]|nr:hypothetical protein [Armatimonadota bacterium]